MTAPLLVLSADDVHHLVHTSLDPEEVIACMANVFELASGSSTGKGVSSEYDRVQQPPRLSTFSPSHETLYMPCRIPTAVVDPESTTPVQTTIKVVSVPRNGGGDGLPSTTLVFDEKTGAIRAVVNSRMLTPLRNAAGSVLATRLLGPQEPGHITLFGAGLQIKEHAKLFMRVYPSIKHCTIINRSENPRFMALVAELRAMFPNKKIDGVVSSSFLEVQTAVQAADIICTATSSTQPLFDSTWLKPGAHVNLIGSYSYSMREADVGLIKRAGRLIVVDDAKSCLSEAGELKDANVKEDEMIEVGMLVRTDSREEITRIKQAGDVTMFKSVGVGAQDVAVAALLVKLAEKDGNVGTRISYN